jgi:hypothetical protein
MLWLPDVRHLVQDDACDEMPICSFVCRDVITCQMILPKRAAFPEFKEQKDMRICGVLVQIVLDAASFCPCGGDKIGEGLF